MRIITGHARGARLKVPHGIDTRPTADRVKESVFNILGARVIDARVLDLFAGTGNLGLEALSRGARQCIFIDSTTANIIRDNATHTKLVNKTEIYQNDVYRVLKQYIKKNNQFELIFCDPPYNRSHGNAVIEMINCSSLLAPNGVIIIEHSRHEVLSDSWESLEIVRTERYGETVVSFIQPKIPDRR